MVRRELFCAIVLSVGIFGTICCSEKSANGQSLPPLPTVVRKTTVTFDIQWATFQKLGFKLNDGIADVEQWKLKKQFENEPYSFLYQTLGRTIEQEPWTPLTNRVWAFDVEAVEDPGAYIEIMKNLERITRGEIKFESVKDHVDIENEKAWVSFSIRGKNYKWNLVVDNDWADPKLFTKVSQLTHTLNTKGRFTYFNTGGQTAVIGYETPESKDAIVRATRLKIEWLN